MLHCVSWLLFYDSSSRVNTHMSWELSMTQGGGLGVHSNCDFECRVGLSQNLLLVLRIAPLTQLLIDMDDSMTWSTIALEASCSSISRRSLRRRRCADHTYQDVDEQAKKKKGLGEKRDQRELEPAQVELIS